MYISKLTVRSRSDYQMYISKTDSKIKNQTIKHISAKLTLRTRSEYQMYISKTDSTIKDQTTSLMLSNGGLNWSLKLMK